MGVLLEQPQTQPLFHIWLNERHSSGEQGLQLQSICYQRVTRGGNLDQNPFIHPFDP